MDSPRWGPLRVAVAILLPFAACAVQWVAWGAIQPFVWFLFYPTVFFSSWIGGVAGGLASTAISSVLVVYFFLPPQLSFALANRTNLFSVAIFVVMGTLFSLTHLRLRNANMRTAAALAEADRSNAELVAANARIDSLYKKTLELDGLRTTFFANISHELRTPLTLILAPLSRWLARTGLAETDRRELELMLRNARLLQRHVTDLLDVARLEAGRMTIRHVRTDTAHLARYVASHFSHLASEQRIDLEVKAPETLTAEVDPDKVLRILTNLLSNAFKFSPSGSRIELRVETQEDHVVLTVRDNGPGVPEHLREAVFERFRQADDSSHRTHGGTGLGLAIVQELARLHDGSVALSETPGGGATFRVTLPRQAPAGAAVHAADEATDRSLDLSLATEPTPPRGELPAERGVTGATVLVVEDNPDMREYLARLLASAHRVLVAVNGRDGLRAAEANHPSLIITDVMMPDMDGVELLAAIRAAAGLAGTPVLVLSARDDEELRVRLLHAGAQDYLVKPFSDTELLARVERLLRDLRRTEALLGRSEERLLRTLEGSRTGLWDWDLATDELVVDDRWTGTFGRPEAPPVRITSGHLLRLAHPEDREAMWSAVESCRRGGQPHLEVDCRFRASGGHWVWLHARGKVLDWSADGVALRLSGTHQDVSRRKAMERALVESELGYRRLSATLEVERNKLETIIENIPMGIAVADAQGKLLTMNSASLAIHGFASKEEMYQRIEQYALEWVLAYPDGRPMPVEDWPLARAVRGVYVHDFGVRLRHLPDGRSLSCSYNVAPVRGDDGHVALLVLALQDITSRSHAEEELTASAARLNLALEAARAGIWEWDLATNRNYWSDELWDLYAIARGAGEPSYEMWSEAIHPEDRERTQRAVRDAAAAGMDIRTEWRVNLPGGEERWLMSRGRAVRNSEGRTERYLGIVLDITDQKRAQRETEQLEVQLRQAQRMEAVGQLAGGVAHDFNNLLQVMIGNLEMAREDVGTESPAHGSLAEIGKATERARSLVRQLLAFSRRQIIRKEVIHLNDLVTSFLSLLRPVIGEHIELTFTPDADAGSILADRGMLEQVLMNLCVNARDAMGAGGTLTIQTGHFQADGVFCERHTGASGRIYSVLRVSDTGIGMDTETAAHAFEPFFTTKEPGRGTGLGLSTAYGIVRQHDGVIEVGSTPGVGSVFTIYLPATPAASEPAPEVAEGAIVGGDETILLAEDEETVRAITTRVLTEAGYTVLAASNGAEALGYVRAATTRIDLLLLDVVMPGMGGREVFDQAQAIRPRIPALFASGYSGGELHTDFVLSPGTNLIQKPYTNRELLRRVRQVLDSSANSR